MDRATHPHKGMGSRNFDEGRGALKAPGLSIFDPINFEATDNLRDLYSYGHILTV